MTTVVRSARKQITLIENDSPYTQNSSNETQRVNILINPNEVSYYKTWNSNVQNLYGDKQRYRTQSKTDGSFGNIVYTSNNQQHNVYNYGEHYIDKYIQKHIQQILNHSLVLDDQIDRIVQKAYTPLQTIYDLGNYEQSNYLYIENDHYGSFIPDFRRYRKQQPIKESDIKMITLSNFYKLVRNRLDLRQYPKSKVKSTGLSLMPNTGNYRKWYYGVMYNPKGEKKVTWIPYLSGVKASLEYDSKEIKEETYNYTDEQQRTLSTIGQQWNIDEFKHARQPIPIHKVEDRYAFQYPMPNVVNLPIKMMGDDTIYLPVEYEGMSEALSKIFAYEKAVNPNYSDYYAYLTVDKRTILENSDQGVYHVDGFQSAEQTNMTVQRNYAVCDVVPIQHVVDPMETRGLIGDTVGEFYKSFAHQSQHVDKMETVPFQIYLYDAFQVHKTTQAMVTTDRTYLRVSFTQRRLNRLGNGINPLIPHEWTYVPQNLEAEVTR
jgi:hypothetical protein